MPVRDNKGKTKLEIWGPPANVEEPKKSGYGSKRSSKR